MQTTTATTEEVVRKLIEVCHDGRDGFQVAADAVDDAPLKAELLRYSRQRAQFISDLELEMHELGRKPPVHGTIAGMLRRGWLHLSNVISRGHESAILSACHRADEAAVDVYAEAAEADLPTGLQELVAAQNRVIQSVHERIGALCNGARMD
jgi:uncharacterized protein (TIGR02284 family)